MNTEEQKVSPEEKNSPISNEEVSFNIGGTEVSAPVTGSDNAEEINLSKPSVEEIPEVASFNIGGTEVSAPTGSKEEPVTIIPENTGEVVVTTTNELKEVSATSDVITESSVDVVPEVSTQESIPKLTPEIIDEATKVRVEDSNVAEAVAPTEVILDSTPTEFVPEGVSEEVSIEEIAPSQTLMSDGGAESITPSQGEVINTEKAKGSNPLIIFIFLIIGFALVFSMDKIMLFFQNRSALGGEGKISEIESSNLVDGFIQIDVTNSYMKTKGIKFYNFKKAGNKVISLNYVSDENYKTVDDLKLFVEVYDSDKDLVYKEQFKLDSKLDKDNVLQYSLNVTNDVYENSYYVKVSSYTDDMLNKKDSMICSYPVKNSETFTLTFTTTYNFVNDLLVSYDVVRKYETTDENDIVELYKGQIKDEYLSISDYNIKTDYADNKLVYSINLESLPDGFIPMYAKGSTKKTIKNKEALKKWNCK